MPTDSGTSNGWVSFPHIYEILIQYFLIFSCSYLNSLTDFRWETQTMWSNFCCSIASYVKRKDFCCSRTLLHQMQIQAIRWAQLIASHRHWGSTAAWRKKVINACILPLCLLFFGSYRPHKDLPPLRGLELERDMQGLCKGQLIYVLNVSGGISHEPWSFAMHEKQ